MEGNRLNYEKDNKVSEFILPPMSEWDNPGESSSKGVESSFLYILHFLS